MKPVIYFDTNKLKKLNKDFDKFEQRLTQDWMRKALRAAGELILLSDADRAFQKEGAIHGLEKWHDISQTTKNRKGKNTILTDTGQMRKANQIFKSDNNRLIVGNAMEYSGDHQYGKGFSNVEGNWQVEQIKRPIFRSFNRKIIKKTAKRIIDLFKANFERFLK